MIRTKKFDIRISTVDYMFIILLKESKTFPECLLEAVEFRLQTYSILTYSWIIHIWKLSVRVINVTGLYEVTIATMCRVLTYFTTVTYAAGHEPSSIICFGILRLSRHNWYCFYVDMWSVVYYIQDTVYYDYSCLLSVRDGINRRLERIFR
jgi:hypothetical protein